MLLSVCVGCGAEAIFGWATRGFIAAKGLFGIYF